MITGVVNTETSMPTSSSILCSLFLIPFLLAHARAENVLKKPPALEATLKQWQRDSAKIKTLECEFEVWENDPIFDKRTHRGGRFHYQAPDKAAFRIEWDLLGAELKPIKKPAWWIRDGRSCYYGSHDDGSNREQIVEIRWSNEALAQTLPFRPLPFLFGTTAKEWKQYGVLSETTTDQERASGQTWLSLLPRDPAAQGISKVELILTLQTDERLLLPMAVKLHSPNGKCDECYGFKNLQVNQPRPKAGSDPFKRRFSRSDGEHVVLENLGNGDLLGPHISRYPLWLPLFPAPRSFAD